MFKPKTEKIYKFVYEIEDRWNAQKKTLLLTASDPVQAVKAFNNKAGDKLVNIVEFIEVVPKIEESSQ